MMMEHFLSTFGFLLGFAALLLVFVMLMAWSNVLSSELRPGPALLVGVIGIVWLLAGVAFLSALIFEWMGLS